MSAPLTVGAHPGSAGLLPSLRPVWASLPVFWHEAGAPPLDVVAIDGGDAGWPAAATDAIAGGVRGVVVVHPSASTPADDVLALAAAAAAGGAAVIVQSAWSSDPALAALPTCAASAVGAAIVITCHAEVGALTPTALREQVELLAALGVPRLRAAHVRTGDHSWTVHALAGELVVVLTLERAVGAPRAHLRARSGESELDLLVPHSEVATPARVRVFTAEAELVAPSLYESGARATWRRVHEALTAGAASAAAAAGAASSADLERLADALADTHELLAHR